VLPLNNWLASEIPKEWKPIVAYLHIWMRSHGVTHISSETLAMLFCAATEMKFSQPTEAINGWEDFHVQSNEKWHSKRAQLNLAAHVSEHPKCERQLSKNEVGEIIHSFFK